jgi:hypothetical protein
MRRKKEKFYDHSRVKNGEKEDEIVYVPDK